MRYPPETYDTLWITQLARYSGAETLAKRLDYPGYGPYIFVLFVVFFDYVILSTVGAIRANWIHAVVQNPILLLTPVGLLFVVWTIKELVNHFTGVKEDHELDIAIEQRWMKYTLLLMMVVVHACNFLIFRGVEPFFTRFGPIIGTLKLGFLYPVLYFPIIAELVTVVLVSFLVIPYYFVKGEYPLEFDDPMNIGGLESIGDIMKKSFYAYSFGLVFAQVWIYAPFVLDLYTGKYPGLETNFTIQHALAWILGISLFLYGVFRLHFYMQREKRKKIEDINKEIRDLGNDSRGLPETELNRAEQPELWMKQMEMEKVRKMRTWPFTAAAQERVLFSAVVPIVFDRLISIFLI